MISKCREIGTSEYSRLSCKCLGSDPRMHWMHRPHLVNRRSANSKGTPPSCPLTTLSNDDNEITRSAIIKREWRRIAADNARLSITGFVLRFRLFLFPSRPAVTSPSLARRSNSSVDDRETERKDNGVSALLFSHILFAVVIR